MKNTIISFKEIQRLSVHLVISAGSGLATRCEYWEPIIPSLKHPENQDDYPEYLIHFFEAHGLTWHIMQDKGIGREISVAIGTSRENAFFNPDVYNASKRFTLKHRVASQYAHNVFKGLPQFLAAMQSIFPASAERLQNLWEDENLFHGIHKHYMGLPK